MRKPVIENLLVQLSKATTDKVGNGLRGAFVVSAIEAYSKQVIAESEASDFAHEYQIINQQAWLDCAKSCLELIEKTIDK
jgi:hypothetical protein